MGKRVSVISETDSGRNQQFRDNLTGRRMSRSEFVQAIEAGRYSNYHVRIINEIKTPASDPDASENNNLG